MFWIPFTKWTDRDMDGARAINHLFTIKQRPGLEFGVFIYAQEISESNGKLFPSLPWGIVAGIIAGVVAWHLGAPWWAPVLLAIGVGNLALRIAASFISKTKRLEAMGKAVTIRAAVRFGGQDEDWYMRNQIIRSLHNNMAYPQFAGWTPERIEAEVRSHYAAADRWLDKHWAKIERAYAKGNPLVGEMVG